MVTITIITVIVKRKKINAININKKNNKKRINNSNNKRKRMMMVTIVAK